MAVRFSAATAAHPNSDTTDTAPDIKVSGIGKGILDNSNSINPKVIRYFTEQLLSTLNFLATAALMNHIKNKFCGLSRVSYQSTRNLGSSE